jgi:hypothetical protein
LNLVQFFHHVSPTAQAPLYVTTVKSSTLLVLVFNLASVKAAPVAAADEALLGLKSGVVRVNGLVKPAASLVANKLLLKEAVFTHVVI